MSNEIILRERNLPEISTRYLSHVSYLLSISELHLIPYRLKGAWGFCDLNGTIKIKCIFDSVRPYDGGCAIVQFKDKFGAIDSHGKFIITPVYDHLFGTTAGLMVGVINNRYRFVDIASGKEQFDIHFDHASLFRDGFATIVLNGKNGVIDEKGNIAVLDQYSQICSFHDGLSMVSSKSIKGKIGFINKELREVVPCIYHFTSMEFWDGYALVKDENEMCGFINKNGKVVIPLIYENANMFNEGFAPVKSGNRWGFVNETGELVIPFSFDDASIFASSYACVGQDAKYGFIDLLGNLAIEFQFDESSNFYGNHYFNDLSKPLAVVKKDGFAGVINKQGEEVLPIIYYSVYFENGLIRVIKESDWGYISLQGKEYWQD